MCYSMPVMVMSKLKLSISLMPDDTDKVKIVSKTESALTWLPSLFQLNVMYVEAEEGFQLSVVMFNVMGIFPSFRM